MTQATKKYTENWHCLEEINFINDKSFNPTAINFCGELVIVKLKTKTKDVNLKLTRKQVKKLREKLNNLSL